MIGMSYESVINGGPCEAILATTYDGRKVSWEMTDNMRDKIKKKGFLPVLYGLMENLRHGRYLIWIQHEDCKWKFDMDMEIGVTREGQVFNYSDYNPGDTLPDGCTLTKGLSGG